MTSIAVISDIHSDAVALAAVEEEMGHLGVERAWCLGDSVDWLLPRVPELRGSTVALRRVRELCEENLAGNHEAELLATDEGRALVSSQPDGEELLAYLDSLASAKERGAVLLVHGSPVGPVWDAVETEDDTNQAFALTEARLVLCGHTHLPFLASADADGKIEIHRLPRFGEEQRLSPSQRWLVNPGAVGRAPVEGFASWAILELDEYDLPVAVRWQLTPVKRPLPLFR